MSTESSSLPSTYRAVIVESANGDFKIINKPLPSSINNNQVLVKVLACGVCHSDSICKMGHSPLCSYPRVPGHEVIGEVVKVGDDVKRFKVGDIVGQGWHGGHCFQCDRCVRGDFIGCKAALTTGLSTDGGYQEYLLTTWNALALCPNDIKPEEAAPLLCAGLTVFNGLRSMDIRPPALIAVQGCGGLGHLAIQFACKMGYNVAVISTSDDKKELSERLGAKYFINSTTENPSQALQKLGGAQCILATAFDSDSMTALVDGLSVNGVLLTLGADYKPIQVSPLQILMKRAAIQGWPSGSPIDSEDTVNFAHDHNINAMVETYSLDEVSQAYDRMMSGKSRFRVVIAPHKQ